VCKDALEEVEGGDEIVPFMRAGTATSPADTRLFWMGDQNLTYTKFDGMQSAMIGLLNANMSGFTMGHSDIGGYTSSTNPVFPIIRDANLNSRWIEMSAFSDMIMRSHPTNLPDDNLQIYNDVETVQFMAKFVRIHANLLNDYKQQLMQGAYENGTPIIRSLMLNFPDD